MTAAPRQPARHPARLTELTTAGESRAPIAGLSPEIMGEAIIDVISFQE
jgi:hypothetical protein